MNSLFPFHLLINPDLLIESCGSSMQKLHGCCVDRPMSDSFEIKRPVEPVLSFSIISTLVNQLVLLKILRDDGPELLIKGQFVRIESDDKLLFVGTPWFDTLEDLRTADMMISDFPHQNPTIDFLHRLKSQKIINDDLNKLVITINEQKNKLKIGEEQILYSLQKEREINQMKSNYVTFASHEFRTPLACIRSSIELLQIKFARSGVLSSSTVKHHNNIVSEVDHLSVLINEFLTIGKIESNNFTCKKEVIDLTLTLQKVIEKLTLIQDDGRSVIFNACSEIQFILADPHLIEYILNNLLSNALKYSKGEADPRVTVSKNENSIFIKIQDFGMGIPSNEQSKIFQAFFRAENAGKIAGTGVGMFIAKNFTELHGGNITFKSIKDIGTEFVVSLPLT